MEEKELYEITSYFSRMENEIIAVVISLILGLVAIKLCLKLIKRMLLISNMDNALISFVHTSINVILKISLLLYCLQKLNIPLTSMIAVLSAAGVAIGLAIQDSIANVANGLVMIGTHPFKVGDYVQVDNDEGTIEELRLMNTVLSTKDNKRLVLPNKKVFNSRIVNYNTNSLRRVDLKFTVDYDTDLDFALKITERTCRSCSTVLLSPSPRIAFYEAGASSLVISAWCWIKTAEYWDAYFQIQKAVYDAYKANDINIPFDQITISQREVKKVVKPKIEKKVEVKAEPLVEEPKTVVEKTTVPNVTKGETKKVIEKVTPTVVTKEKPKAVEPKKVLAPKIVKPTSTTNKPTATKASPSSTKVSTGK